MGVSRYRRLQPQYADTREIAEITNQILSGKTNNTGEMELNDSATSTTISDERAGFNSFILFMPLTEHAAVEVPYMYVSTRNKGSFTITHRNHGGGHVNDLQFMYVIIG